MAIPESVIMDAPLESSASAVSWGPIVAGAVIAAALSLLLLLVGTGFGFTMVSPWGGSASAGTLGVYAAIWLVVVQWLSAGVGGYLTGRLRTKWTGIHTHEVGFRDTAHGFLAWALSTLFVAALLGSTISSVLGTTAQATATLAGATATTAAATAAKSDTNVTTGYFTDALLRPNDPAAATATDNGTAAVQLSRILANAAIEGKMPDADRVYVETLVAARTGLSQADAKTRVDTVLKQIDEAKLAAKQATDKARKTAAATALLGALSLFVGAFIAAAAAAYGGRQRDDEEEVLRSA